MSSWFVERRRMLPIVTDQFFSGSLTSPSQARSLGPRFPLRISAPKSTLENDSSFSVSKIDLLVVAARRSPSSSSFD